MGQILHPLSRNARRHGKETNMDEDTTHCQVHGTSLMRKKPTSDSCWAHFHDAIVKGKLETCRELLTATTCTTDTCLGALTPTQRLRHLDSIAFSKLRTTSLHMAALYRRPDLIKLLLEHGSDPRAMDGFGRAPAAVLLEHWPRLTFTSSGHEPCCNPEAGRLERVHNSDTLLQLWAGREDCAHNQNILPVNGGGREMDLFRQQVVSWRAGSAQCLKLLLKHGLELNDVADRRRASTLLHIAARYDLVDVIQIVLNTGTKDVQTPTYTEQISETCRNCAAAMEENRSCHGRESASQSQEGLKPIAGHQPESASQSQEGLKPIAGHQPEMSSVPKRVNRIMSNHIRSVIARSQNGVAHWMWNHVRKNKTCGQAHRASEKNRQDVQGRKKSCSRQMFEGRESSTSFNEMAKAGEGGESEEARVPVDLEVRNGTAKTPLAVAVDRGSLNAAHCLLSHGADIFTVDFYGRSILHFLSERDSTFDLLLLDVLRKGVDVGSVDNGGNTALHVAAYMGNANKVRYLLSAGASPDDCNLAGKTPLFLAFQRRDPSAREIILLFLLSSVLVKARDKLQRVPMLLQQEDNANSQLELDHLYSTCNTLLRRCIVAVRRGMGVSRLVDMMDLGFLPCPGFVQRAISGEEERRIVNMLNI